MFCTNCGKEINDMAKFCPKCGWKYEGEETADIQLQVQPVGNSAGQKDIKSAKRLRIAPVYIVTIAVLLLAVLAVYKLKVGNDSASGDSDSHSARLAPEEIYAGNTITFGQYNGMDTEWIVLETTGAEALLLCKYPLENKPHCATINTPVTWESSLIRGWLNNDYYNSGFNKGEKKLIQETAVVNNTSNIDNAQSGLMGGNDTVDKLFLFSIDEYARYRSMEGVYCGEEWWLRSPGDYDNYVAFVRKDGAAISNGVSALSEWGVRPAMWIKIQ